MMCLFGLTGLLKAQEQQYRIKALSYNSTDYYGNMIGPYNFTTDMYLNIDNNDAHANGANGGVSVTTYSESNSQIFTLEDAGNGTFYIKSIDGYYIYCQSWNVDAIDQSQKSAIGFSYIDNNTFYMMNGSKYFKVERVGSYYYPFCDYGYTDMAAKWVLEAIINDDITPAAPANLEAKAESHNKISLTWTAGDEYAISYNIYDDAENLIAEDIQSTSYIVENLPNAEKEYCFTVKAVRGENLSDPAQACATTLTAPAIQYIEITDGTTTTSNYIPTNFYYGYSLTQQIYTAEQLGFGSGTISEIAFYRHGTGVDRTRTIDVYMINTDKTSFDSNSDWVPMSASNKVYSGTFTGTTGNWSTIDISDFEYDGRNLLICIDDNTGNYSSNTPFKLNSTSTNTAIYIYNDGTNYSPSTPPTNASGRIAKNNQIKFTVEFKPQVPTVNVDTENIAFETPVRGGSYWTERAGVQPIEVVITPKGGAEVTNIELVDNSFFSIPADIDLTANPITFNVSTGVSNEAGTKTATLRITHTAEGETIDIPVTAEVYMAAQGDVIENPFEVTFDENGSYTYTITSLDGFYDDYIFSENEQYDANTPDVVFELTIAEGEKALVGATTANCWISRYDGFTPENGPATKHNYPETEVLSAGTYYFVLAPNSWNLPFDFTITKTAVPAPVVSYSNPYNGAVNQDNPMLEWSMNYADEYQVLLGTTNPPTDVVVDWTSELATSYQTENLQNNTKYFWQVNARNEAGITTGEVYSFVTLLNTPTEVAATTVNLYPGEATTISWTAAEGATEYNVYVNGAKVATTTETSYELSELAYNMTGYNVTVSATHVLGESLQSEAVVVKVAGSFPLVVSVKDASGNPIEGATVTIDMTKAYDEFKNQVAAVEDMITNEEGTATVTLPVLGGYIGESYGNGVWSPEYKIKVSKTPYTEVENSITYSYISNGTTKTQNVTLYLPTISWISFEDQVVTVGSDIVLTWSNSGVEEATAYNVYKKTYGGVETLVGKVTTNGVAIETTEETHDNIGSKYGVSAVFGDVETSVTYTSKDIYVLGNGSFYGYVIDGTNPISGLTFELSGTNAIGDDIVILTTNADGSFEGEILEGDNYTLTISHYDYEKFVMPGIVIDYSTPNDLGTIVLTAKPKATISDVTATDNGEYANVTWTGSYEKYNVYRRNVENPQEVELLGEATASPYKDNEWAELEDGTYQYGVSTFVEEQAQSRGSEVILEANFDDGVIPSGWNVTTVAGMSGNWYWYVYNGQAYSSWFNDGGDATIYLITPLIKTSNSTLEFDYMSAYYNGTDRSDFYVRYSTDPNGPWSDEYLHYSKYSSSGYNFDHIIVDLSIIEEEQVYIAFCHTNVNWGGNGIKLDNIVVTSESSAKESQIVWSDNLTKQGPATFVGGDSEKPTAWNVAANWNTNEVPSAGADVIINANAVISSEVNVKSLTINGTYNDTNLTIANGGTLIVTGTITQTNYQLILEEGGQIFQNNANVTARFRMSIDNPKNWSNANTDGWQFISMPMTDVSYDSFASTWNPTTAQSTCDFDLYKYDGSQDNEWQNYRDGFDYYGNPETTFRSGTGYLASRKEVETVTVSGTLNTVIPYAFQNYAPSFYDEDKDLANFRLFGNPFTYDIHFSDFTAQSIVNGYAVIAKDGNYVYKTTEPIKVGEGFFIKATDWTQFVYAPNTRSSKEKSNSINVIATGKAGKDNVVINFAGQSEGFDKLQNFNKDIATVFVANNGKRYGIANVDENATEVELSFVASQMGNYSISLDVNGEFETVTLVDRFTGIETNMLLEDEYNFTATSRDNANRFVVRLANGQEPTANSQFVYQSGEELILGIEGSVQIVDMLGRVVYSNEHANGNNRISVSEFNNAAYVVRVVNEEGVKVQKVVIY